MPWKVPAKKLHVGADRLDSRDYQPARPTTPLRHPPGSEGRIRELRRRLQRGEALFDEIDTETNKAIVVETEKNGRRVVVGETDVRPDPGEDRDGPPPWYERLRQARERAGLSQRDLTRLACVPRSTIANLERGERDSATLWVVWRIADALRIGLDDLIGREVPRNPAA